MTNKLSQQQGHSLVQSLLGLMLSMLVLLAALSAFGWVQTSHRQLQTQAEVQQRLRSALQLLRLRVHRAGAPGLGVDSVGKFKYELPPQALLGTNTSLSLVHLSSLTPADCQGHEATYFSTIEDLFELAKPALKCKDAARDDTLAQELVDGLSGMSLLYAQAMPGTTPQLQWLSADKVTLWRAVRGVQICLQADARGNPAPRSQACSTSSSNTPSLAWRGVAAWRHFSP